MIKRRLLVCRALIAACAWPGLANAAQHNRGDDITGWQKLTWGMTIEQAMAALPSAEINDAFCGEERKQYVPPAEACKQVWAFKVPAAGLTWDVVLKFSNIGELFDIELSITDRSRANFDTYRSLLANLNQRYRAEARDKPFMNPVLWTTVCNRYREKSEAGEPVRKIDFLQNRAEHFASIERDTGFVVLKYYEREWCDGTPEDAPTTRLNGPYLEIRYTRRSQTTAEGL